MGFKRSRAVVMPQFGVIKGGRLNGWRFHFLRFKVQAPAEFLVLARCTPPNWPFPCDIELNETHFGQLRAVPGERAKRTPVLPMLRRAFEDAVLPVPAWMRQDDAKPMTLRATVKRSRSRRISP